MRIYDTAQRSVVELELGDHVGMYVCGITPYDATHLGHAATYLAYDLLIRRLEDRGHAVTLVRNYTDVDDSILLKAAELGEHYLSLAEREIERFEADMTALGARPAAHEPRATRSIDGMITMISQLLEAGHAYVSADRVFFDVATFPEFGKLSGYSADRMTELAAERGGNSRRPPPAQPARLRAVAGQRGRRAVVAVAVRPGASLAGTSSARRWATQRSARRSMSTAAAATWSFPHHECEIAQSEAVHGAPLARYWVHAALVSYQGHKMSKSLGNLVFISDLRAAIDPRAIRLALMAHHYRTEWEWFDAEGPAAQRDLDTLVGAVAGASPAAGSTRESSGLLAEVQAVLDDDLNAPTARTALLDAAATAGRGAAGATLRGELAAAAALCGIDLSKPLAAAP